MKINEEGNLDYTFRIKKVRLGSLPSGAVYWYYGKLWVILNRVESGAKLVHTIGGSHHESDIQSSTSLVYHILSGKKRK